MLWKRSSVQRRDSATGQGRQPKEKASSRVASPAVKFAQYDQRVGRSPQESRRVREGPGGGDGIVD
jgi:hypothetical protein